jgi:hypothetical protein
MVSGQKLQQTILYKVFLIMTSTLFSAILTLATFTLQTILTLDEAAQEDISPMPVMLTTTTMRFMSSALDHGHSEHCSL